MLNRLIAITAALIFITSCGQSSAPTTPSPSPSPSPPGTASVSIVPGARTLTTTAYNPNPIAISAGMTIIWVNNDSIAHTSTSNNRTWDSGNLAPGGSFSRTFPSAGTFQYFCTIHPNMVGTVTVQ